jgi:hypothetical protein
MAKDRKQRTVDRGQMTEDRGQWEMEYGMRIAGKEMVECLILIFSAFQGA